MHTSSPYALTPAPSSPPALKLRTRVPQDQLTQLLLVCIGPGRRLSAPLLFQPFYSDPSRKHCRTLIGWSGLETGINQSAATRPPRGEQKPVPAGLETNKRAEGRGVLAVL